MDPLIDSYESRRLTYIYICVCNGLFPVAPPFGMRYYHLRGLQRPPGSNPNRELFSCAPYIVYNRKDQIESLIALYLLSKTLSFFSFFFSFLFFYTFLPSLFPEIKKRGSWVSDHFSCIITSYCRYVTLHDTRQSLGKKQQKASRKIVRVRSKHLRSQVHD